MSHELDLKDLIEWARKQRAILEKMANNAPLEDQDEVKRFYKKWVSDGRHLEAGEKVTYEDVVYKVLVSHDTQEAWTPTAAVSLFAPQLTSDDGAILEWKQPDSTNGYQLGDRVSHVGKIWESTFAGSNVWEPAAIGTESLWMEVTE